MVRKQAAKLVGNPEKPYKLLVGKLRASRSDHHRTPGKLAALVKAVQGRHELLFCQISRCAENDDRRTCAAHRFILFSRFRLLSHPWDTPLHSRHLDSEHHWQNLQSLQGYFLLPVHDDEAWTPWYLLCADCPGITVIPAAF
jgi:hypothetical protein